MNNQKTSASEEPDAQRPAALTAADRCDRCGAQAYLRVELAAAGLELLFCAHHAGKHREELDKMDGAVIHDETSRLEPARP